MQNPQKYEEDKTFSVHNLKKKKKHKMQRWMRKRGRKH